MGRKTQITKEMMLQAAYEILKEEGYPMVNIKTIAAKVGCSTQPISWQFGNMQGMRKELYKYASEQIFGDIEQRIANMNAMEAFFESGKIYISNACDYPNVFRFLCVDDPGDIVKESSNIAELLGDEFIKEMLAKEIELPRETIDKAVELEYSLLPEQPMEIRNSPSFSKNESDRVTGVSLKSVLIYRMAISAKTSSPKS